MLKPFHRWQKKAALAPGSIVFVGERQVEEPRITLIEYDEKGLEERELTSIVEAFACRDSARMSWINVDGLHDTDLLKSLGEHFGVHPLVLEDIVHTRQRPKLEDYQDYAYVVVRMLTLNENSGGITEEQISLILGPGYVLSFQERPGDVFAGVRERIRAGKGRIRRKGSDYLAYALLDAVVDHDFVILEKLGDRIEILEDELVERPSPVLLQELHGLKREVILLRKSVWPLREVISGLARMESPLVGEETKIFLRDVYDHTIRVIDTVEAFRDMLASLHDLYLSSVSNRMNEIMKVLTIMATIFIPLTFLAGVYGMNFEFMPELGWKWAYPAWWIAIGVMGALMLILFRRKHWL